MGYTKINSFAGATSSQADLDADISALRTAVNAVATADIDDESIRARHFAEPKPRVFHRVIDGSLVTTAWERRGFGENMFAVVKRTGQCWSGDISKIRNRSDYFLKSMPYPRSSTNGGITTYDHATPIISKRLRLGDRSEGSSFVLKIFASIAHVVVQDYDSANAPEFDYPSAPVSPDIGEFGYFVLMYKSAAETRWTQIDATKRHLWPQDDAFDSYVSVCDYNVSTALSLGFGPGVYDFALCYIRSTYDAIQLVVGPVSLHLTAYHKA